MSDTWSDIQALKSRQSSMRERLARRKKEREGLVADITGQSQAVSAAAATTSSSSTISVKKGIYICNIVTILNQMWKCVMHILKDYRIWEKFSILYHGN